MSVEKVAIMNQMEPSTRLEAGQKVKIVQGTVRESAATPSPRDSDALPTATTT